MAILIIRYVSYDEGTLRRLFKLDDGEVHDVVDRHLQMVTRALLSQFL